MRPRPEGALARFARSEKASAALFFALTLPLVVGTLALATDLGIIYTERRQLQKATDAAALAAALQPQRAEAAARRMLDANGEAGTAFSLRFGRFAGAAADRDARFAEGPESGAVAVAATREVPMFFARSFGHASKPISAEAQAAVLPVVSLALGGRLASADPALTDPLLGSLLGSGLNLTVLDYRALAGARIEFGALARALGAAAGLSPATPLQAVLSRPASLATLMTAAATVLDRSGQASAAAVARKLARQPAALLLSATPAGLAALDAESGAARLDYPNRGLAAEVSGASLVGATLAARGAGSTLRATLSVPGLAVAETEVLIGEDMRKTPPMALGRLPKRAGTATLRARLRLRSSGLVALAGSGLDVPVELVVGAAEAEVLSVHCAANAAEREVRLGVVPGPFRLSLGWSEGDLATLALGDVPAPATLLKVPLARVEASGTVRAAARVPAVAVFRGAEIGNGTVKTVRTTGLADSVAGSLLAEAKLDIRAGPLGLGLAGLAAPVSALLQSLAEPVDAVLDAALALAGVGIGEADVRVDDLVCNQARLNG